MSPPPPATLVVSLDCELHWGVHDRVALADYRANLMGGRAAVAPLLELFGRYGVRATWAIVGLLFARTREEALELAPPAPRYADERLSAHRLFGALGRDEAEDPLHFAGSLIDLVAARGDQEIASHTFAHAYALEPGQDAAGLRADLLAARRIAAAHGHDVTSLVFPRNQVDRACLPVLRETGFTAFRGTPPAWAYRAGRADEQSPARRALRLLDAHLPLLDTVAPRELQAPGGVVDVPATRYVRPWTPGIGRAGTLRVRRIAHEMRAAAEHGGLVHLWWHPHDFGAHLPENLAMLEAVLRVYAGLHRRGRMVSLQMREAAAAA